MSVKAFISRSGQVTTEYALATGLLMVIFVWFHTVIQQALKKLFANAAFIILNAWR